MRTRGSRVGAGSYTHGDACSRPFLAADSDARSRGCRAVHEEEEQGQSSLCSMVGWARNKGRKERRRAKLVGLRPALLISEKKNREVERNKREKEKVEEKNYF